MIAPASEDRPRLVLLVLVPFSVVLIGGVVWLHGGRTVGTEDAYVKTDIAQIAPEVSGRVVEVLVRDHQIVEAGTPLVKLDPEPFRLALDKAEAELDNARTDVETARAQWHETESELARSRKADRISDAAGGAAAALAATGTASITKLDEAQNAAVGRARPGRRSSRAGWRACWPRLAATRRCRPTNTRWSAKRRPSATAPSSTWSAPRSRRRSAAPPST